MAKAIATITGTALAPGVSRNGRLYKAETIGKMVARASERIAAGKRPIAMYTSHDSADVADIGGVITRIWQESDGRARYTADVPDTPTGRAVAALADDSDGPRFLDGVSIFGNWVGGARHEKGPDGKLHETGSDFELGRLDFTTSPGVDAASIDTVQATADGGEAASEYAVSESAPEALVTALTEDAQAQPVAESATEGGQDGLTVPDGVREALTAFLGAPVAEASLPGTVAMGKRKSGMSGGGRKYADPGYQADKKQRYDITDKAHAVAAWRYINQAKKAAKYSAAQLKNIKARIRAALKSFGVTAAAEGWVIEPAYQVTEAVAEWYGDPGKAGSWCVTASNGPVSLTMSCYGMDPADLQACLSAAAGAAGNALAALDPDMDGDVDVPGATNSDTDGDGGSNAGLAPGFAGKETAPGDDDVTEDAPPATEPAAETGTDAADAAQTGLAEDAAQEQEGVSAVPDTDTQQAAGAAESAPAAITKADLDKAVKEASESAAAAALEAYKAQRKADKKAARKAAASGTQGTTETAPAAPVAESADAVKQAVAEALAAAGIKPKVEETQEEREARLVQEGVREAIQGLVAAGAVIPGRSGLQVREHATDPEQAPDAKALAEMPDDEFAAYAGANLDKYMGDNTRIQAIHG